MSELTQFFCLIIEGLSNYCNYSMFFLRGPSTYDLRRLHYENIL